MSHTESQAFQSPSEKRDSKDTILFVYFSILLTTFIVLGAMPFLKESMSLEASGLTLKIVWVVLGLSQLLLPFTVKDKKRKSLALILASILAIAFIAMQL